MGGYRNEDPSGDPLNEFFGFFFSPEPNIDLKTKSQPKKLKVVYVTFVVGAVFLEGGLIQPLPPPLYMD